MKKIIISLVFALIAYFDLSACEYTLECWDAWGDGWNGGYMEVYINGSYQGDAYADGIGTIWTITANQGDLLEFYYVSGSYEDENEWYLYNSSGTLIAGDGPYPNTGWVLWHTVNCGSIAPSIAGDCSDALNVCTDLGFQIDANGYGSINEIPPLGSLGNPLNNNPGGSGNEGCLQIGESNSTWMIVNIAGDGNLEFNFGGSSQSGYYDWIMYPYDENSCTNIPANLVAPVRCNWNAVSYGGTGLAATTPPGGNSGNFEPPLPVVCGEQYIICFSNYSSAVTNVPLQFSGSASVACLPLSCAGTSSCNSSPGDPIYQDCMNAIPVCQDYFCQESSYSGSGSIQNEINPASSCLSGGELNDVWYIFTILQSGNLHFEITPNDLADDYDWALYNLTDASCGDIYTNPSLEESCNYSSTPGVTGADGSSTFNSQPASGSPGNAALPVYAGETYVLNISNYSSSQSGYELDFSQSTATIFDNVPPSLSTITSAPTCGANQITFQFSENVLCSTVQNCDFSITGPGGPYALSGVAGLSCSSGGMQEDVFSININPPVTVNGSYNLNLVPGCGFVEDLCGNVATAGSLSFTITALTSSATSSQINCFGSCNGDATVTASNGTPPYDYYWEDNNGTIVSNINNSSAVQNTVTNLCAGVYSVTITDNLGCSSQSTTSISEPPQLSITLTSTAESCGASDGTITAVVSGGTGLYDFNILPNGNNIYNQNSPYTFTNLNAGSYSVTVTDENNCTASGNISINSGGNVTAGFTYSGNQCYTPGNNIISFTSASTGGTNYSWDFNGDGYVDNNTTNPSWLFTTPGSYNVSLTVTNGQCSDIETINVLIYDGITLISSFSNSTCGVSNGSASVSVVNGTSGYFYDWMPNGFTGDGTSTYSNLPPGNYLVTVTDINSCTASTNIIVGNQDGMNVSVSSTDVSCSGVANGTVTVSISNGTPVYSYSWLQGTNSDSNTTGSNVFSLTGLNTGTIYITVTDANNCSYFGSAIINQAENLSLTANVNNISCYGNSDGMAWVSIINGIPPFNYLWLNSAGDIISTQEYALNMPAGIFGLTITDSTGCTSSQTIILSYRWK
ncbi:MAG: hypothetical protein HY738_11680 [Bacteroidia bacterium]|nr:hypothetical protein [Bacteroidia bacterium]